MAGSDARSRRSFSVQLRRALFPASYRRAENGRGNAAGKGEDDAQRMDGVQPCLSPTFRRLRRPLSDQTATASEFALMELLATSIAHGDFALLLEMEVIRIAFERRADAVALAEAVGARSTMREGGWAGQWAFVLDDGLTQLLRIALPTPPP